MKPFQYEDDEFYCEELPIAKIAEEVGTPFYLYSKNRILENLRHLSTWFHDLSPLICYALKANSNEAILSFLAQEGAGADVVSGGELWLALKNGFPPDRIVYAGVGKTDAEIKYALENDILAFNVESQQEINVINDIAASLDRQARISLRLNPDIDIEGHPYITTGRSENKFGIGADEVVQITKAMRDSHHLELVGLHCHIGSQILDSEPYRKSIRLITGLKHRLEADGFAIQHVDIGGGLGVSYEKFCEDTEAEDQRRKGIIEALLPDLRQLNCQILMEPGRSLVADSGCLVTKVLFTKKGHKKNFVVVDAGMTDLLRPSLYSAYHEIVPVFRRERDSEEVDVVGPICESGDFLAQNRMLQIVERGELLAVMTTGAYGFSLSSNYNARVRPPEILVDVGSFHVIRERGKREELWK